MVSCNETKSEWISITKDKGFERDSSIVFTEQFVKQVHHFSSQYGSDISISYTAYNIAGNPSKFPDYGDFPQAFVMVREYGTGNGPSFRVLHTYYIYRYLRTEAPLPAA